MDREKIKLQVMQEGADLVGICRAEDLAFSHPRQNPKALMPDCQSIIVYALRHLDGPFLSPVMRTSLVDTMNIYRELGHIGYQIGRFLENTGFQAIWIHPAYPVEMSEETRGLKGDISLRHAAVAAGLGIIGKNNLLITRSFGPRVRLAAVLTNAELEVDSRDRTIYCDECNRCIDLCPGKALSHEGLNVRECIKIVGGPAGMSSFINFFTEALDRQKEEAKSMFRSPRFWNLYQALQIGSSYNCHSCMSACPIGRKQE